MLYRAAHGCYLKFEACIAGVVGDAPLVAFRHRLKRAVKRRSQLPLLLTQLDLSGEGAEIGVYKADFSEALLRGSTLSKLHLIDPWCAFEVDEYQDSLNVTAEEQQRIFQSVCDRMSAYKARVEIHRRCSLEAAESFDDESLDFIYIDANHSYESCKEDIQAWWPKLRSGGMFAGHDYLNGTLDSGVYGVKDAVDEFIRVERLHLFVTSEFYATWYCFKQ